MSARAWECESVIVTWLIHHGQSLFDYKRRGRVINRWIQLPGPNCDARSQSICTDTPPLTPLPCVPLYRLHPYTHTQVPPAFISLPPQHSIAFCPFPASTNTHHTISFPSSPVFPVPYPYPLLHSPSPFLLIPTVYLVFTAFHLKSLHSLILLLFPNVPLLSLFCATHSFILTKASPYCCYHLYPPSLYPSIAFFIYTVYQPNFPLPPNLYLNSYS